MTVRQWFGRCSSLVFAADAAANVSSAVGAAPAAASGLYERHTDCVSRGVCSES